MSRKIVIIILTLLLASCSASGPMYSNAPHLMQGESGVYIYRPSKPAGGAAMISVDGVNLGKLRSNGYLYKKLAPGSHTIGVVSKDTIFKKVIIPKQIDIKPGTTKYIQVVWKATGGTQTLGNGTIIVPLYDWGYQDVPDSYAKSVMRSLHYSSG